MLRLSGQESPHQILIFADFQPLMFKHLTRSMTSSLIILAGLVNIGCTSTQTVSENVAAGARELKLEAGDTVKVITSDRERFFVEITSINQTGFHGKTLSWSGSSAPPGDPVFIEYSRLALIQEEHFSTGQTVGAVVTVTILGAVVAAAAVGGVSPATMPPPQ